MNLFPRSSHGASVSSTSNGFRFTIPESRLERFRLAQVDSYARLPRRGFSARPPLTVALRARVSSESIPGTWGFGLWNDPLGLSLGFGGNPASLPALPNTVWFFHASPRSYLSFRDDKPAHGFLAQTFSSPQFHPMQVLIGFMLPFSRKRARQLLGRIIDEDSAIVSADATQWHSYRLEWSPKGSAFWLDEALVLETTVSPRPPLGLVLWMDNQYAAFMPDGTLKWGLEKNLTEAWLEIEDLELRTQGRS
ncbi:MAG TPA: hypothetical protein VLZ89_09265 [Anaerolineales bacterium]|nr:hypothetical protein [Anaerolineales bacterium]